MSVGPPPQGGSRESGAYNLTMMLAFLQSLGAAVTPRVVLLLNHVLSAEPLAAQRLRPHAGKCIRLQLRDLPALATWLPSEWTVTVTAAGLLEWQDEAIDRVDLLATLSASNLAQTVSGVLSGQRPRVEVAGDAALAADVNWLIEHLRWDLQDDLARLLGDGPAAQFMRVGSSVMAGLRDALRRVVPSAANRERTAASVHAESPPR